MLVEPVAAVPIYWLQTEQRYAEWVKAANGSLQDCEQQLIGLKKDLAEQKRMLRRLKQYGPGWTERLGQEKERYIRRAGLALQPDQLDVLKLWDELTRRRKELLDRQAEAALRNAASDQELKDLEGKLAALRPARQWALYLEDSAAGAARLRTSMASKRDTCLRKAAEFACIYALVEAETRIQLADLLGLAPDQASPEAVARGLPSLKEKLQAARRALDIGPQEAASYDPSDQLAYACMLAESCLERWQKGISLSSIEDDVLWQLSAVLADADVPALEAAAGAASPDSTLLVEQLIEARRAGMQADDPGAPPEALDRWKAARQALEPGGRSWESWVAAKTSQLALRLREGRFSRPEEPYARRERTRLTVLAAAAEKRAAKLARQHARRRYELRLAAVSPGAVPPEGVGLAGAAAPRPALFDEARLVNLLFALFFTGVVLGMIAYVRHKPDVFLRRIAGLEAVDEAIGRATEMGKPALFVHGLTGVSDIAVLASLSILGRMARRIAEYDSDLLVVNNDPIVYSVSYEVVQEGYAEAGRPDGFKPDNVFMAASEQFPYVAAVAGIMNRRRPATNFFMGYFFAESLILAEVGATTGAIQIAATDAFIQIPFFITTCDYTLMGEELYAAGAYLSKNLKMLATIKAQDAGKAVLLAALPAGIVVSNFGLNWLRVLFEAYEKGF